MTGFCMIMASVMKELTVTSITQSYKCIFGLYCFPYTLQATRLICLILTRLVWTFNYPDR